MDNTRQRKQLFNWSNSSKNQVDADEDGTVSETKWPERKLVIVGDGSCGKTALLMVQSGEDFPDKYFPTIFENFVTTVCIGGNKHVQLSLWDTAGQEDYDRLRPLSYTDTDVVILWVPELRHFLPNVPIILVGNKKDLRDDKAYASRPDTRLIPANQGFELAPKIQAVKYIETSAKTNEQVNELFTMAAKLAMKKSHRKTQRNCLIM
ncbi:hypothetical protein SmJEL517_g05481 [Synchytrium microbalum]|uniref:Small monomeric GTPase n=1 Tax=Synchytrium microbalum TaxID=1806994 RepID=A0A507BW16_9FUNG|nr:uncharacterized protein SmJEL517_g05481 [Synchytrium microbalum]TPX31099.1 hypothetical protein SmJEL517_g05481 [Synchytrium microbalum]